jgi:hypothetical protein
MVNRHIAFGWSIDVAPGWNAEIRQESTREEITVFLAVIPATNDALLRLTPDDRHIMTADKWVEGVARVNRAKGRQVSVARCGEFVGYVVEFDTETEWLRGWALRAGSVPLDATYRCTLKDAGRDDRVVDAMLGSLRLAATKLR